MPFGPYLRNLLRSPSPKEAFSRSFVVTPSDTDEVVAQGLLLSADATVRVELWHDDDPTDLFLTAGVVHALAVKKVYATGTAPAVGDVTIVGFL